MNWLGISQCLRRLFFQSCFPQVFWKLQTIANMSTLGQNVRPVVCGDVLRKIVGAVFCHRNGRKMADCFHLWVQYGVAVSGGVDIMVLIATLDMEELRHSLVRRDHRLDARQPHLAMETDVRTEAKTRKRTEDVAAEEQVMS